MSPFGPRSERIRKEQKRKPSLLKTPKGYLGIILLLLMIIAVVETNDYTALQHVGIAVVTAVVLDILFAVVQKQKRIYPDGAFITGMIIGLVLSSFVSWYIVALTSAMAITSKHLIKVRGKLIFNPAAFGLLLSALLFSSEQSWWGSLSILPIWFVPILLIAGYSITKRVNKFLQVFLFLGVYFSLLLLMGLLHLGNPGDALRVPYVNTVLFLAFFMLTDPPTSLAKDGDQALFGAITAIVSVGAYIQFGGIIFPLIGLLVANIWAAWKRTRNQEQPRKRNVEMNNYELMY